MKYIKYLIALFFVIVIGLTNSAFAATYTETFYVTKDSRTEHEKGGIESFEKSEDGTISWYGHYRYANDEANVNFHNGQIATCGTCASEKKSVEEVEEKVKNENNKGKVTLGVSVAEFQEMYINGGYKRKDGSKVSYYEEDKAQAKKWVLYKYKKMGINENDITIKKYSPVFENQQYAVCVDNTHYVPIFTVKIEVQVEVNDKYKLTVKVEPEGAGTSYINGIDVSGKSYVSGMYVPREEVNFGVKNVKAEYVFTGWEVTPDSSATFNSNMTQSLIMPDHDIVVTAKFSKKHKLTVKVDPKDAGTSYGSDEYIAKDIIEFGVKDVKPNYVFAGWNVEPKLSMPSISTETTTSAVKSTSTMPDCDVIVTAKFNKCDHVFEEVYYGPTTKHKIIHGTAKMTPNHCPSIYPIVGEPLDNLYYISEKVGLSGTFCQEVEILEKKGYTERTCTKCGYKEQTEDNEGEVGTELPGKLLQMNIDSISGVELVYKDGTRVGTSDIVKLNNENWTIKDDFYVSSWNNADYSEELESVYGTIKLESECGDPRCKHVFYIPGPKPIPGENVSFTVHITPPYAGEVTVVYQQLDASGKITTKEEVLTGSGKTLDVLENSVVTVKEVKEDTKYRYINTTTKHGNIITLETKYDHPVPPGGGEIYVNFNPFPEDTKYTLYVTSSLGGEAYITEKPTGLNPVEGKDSFGVRTQTVYNVDKGKEFTIEYTALPGFEFAGWEYRPFVNSEGKNNYTHFSMPASDLTVTAIFKREVTPPPTQPETPPEVKNPTLYVTTNNELWGEAWVIIDGEPENISKAVPGVEYEVYFDSGDEYYFTNWQYDSEISPFKSIEMVYENGVGKAIIIMPSHDLEIKAMFAPIPTDPAITEHKVDFRPEPPEGGDVPEDIGEIITGSTITIAVTPHRGWRFDRWEFYNSNGWKITPDYYFDKNGTGYFIMPDYSVEAVAYFTYIGEPNKVTIEIQGQGTVTVDGTSIASGSVIETQNGSKINLQGNPSDGWTFVYWIEPNGNVLSDDPNYIHTVQEDITIIAVFQQRGPYTLYVSSLFGGNAEIKGVLHRGGNGDYKIEPVGPADDLGKVVYQIKDVYAGDRFEIGYEVTEEGYNFGFWEYKPYIFPDYEGDNGKTGTIQITMPASNLTITAIFKKDDITFNPQISVTTNNADWGTAWTEVNGEPTVSDKKYDVTYGQQFILNYKPKPGYYFINWNYSTLETPFIGENKITMPNMDLEVMAMFAPIPPQGEGGHKIDFTAEPPEGGSVPSDLEDILPGGKVTIAVTPNKGWEFDRWEIRTPDGIVLEPGKDVTIEYNPNGTGYFIMPNQDVVAVAIFKEKPSYKLYVTHYYGGDAWTFDNNGTKTTYVEKAYVGEQYKLGYIAVGNYEFDHWEFRWSGYGNNTNSGDINPTVLSSENIAIMPASDMTVTAVFKEKVVSNEPSLMVSTNNKDWGDAWVVVDGHKYHSEWVTVEPGMEYEVHYKPNKGFEFTNWSTYEYFEEYEPGVWTAILKMPNEKLELMAFFKPGKEEEDSFNLNIEVWPYGAGTAKIQGGGTYQSDIRAYTKVPLIAEANENYIFKGWKKNSRVGVTMSTKEKYYNFEMPAEDITMVAVFELVEVPLPIPEEVTIIINKQGDGAGTIYWGNQYLATVDSTTTGPITEITVANESYLTFRAQPEANSECNGWYKDGRVISSDGRCEVKVDEKDITLIVYLDKKDSVDDGLLESFKIVSVRDLNWMDYFVQNGKLNDERAFPIPKDNGTMLKDKNIHDKEFTQPIKMGYAVEFELITTGTELDNDLELEIIPKVYEYKDIEERDLLEEGVLAGDYANGINYKKIIINKDSNGTGQFMENVQDISKKIPVAGSSTISDNALLWRWVYYLPADTYIPRRYGINASELMVDFDIILKDNGTAKRVVENAQKVLGATNWEGYVFRYSLEESLLDDIYNNAQN